MGSPRYCIIGAGATGLATIDVVRSVWQGQMELAEDVVTRLEAGDRAS